jgi:hypothetical protein
MAAPSKLSPQQRQKIVDMAREMTESGDWVYTYPAIAKMFKVTKPYVSMLAKKAGLAQRQAGIGRTPNIVKVPAEHKEMYITLRTKFGATEAFRLIQEHIKVKHDAAKDRSASAS